MGIEALTQDSVKVTFDVLCEEYAGRNESPVCQEEGEVCYEVYWLSPYDETTDSEPDSMTKTVEAEQPIMVSKACHSFTQTPQTLTYEMSFNVPLPTVPVKTVIRKLPHDGIITNREYLFIVPKQDQ